MFIVELEYTGTLAEIDGVLDDHRAWLNTQYAAGKLLFSGPKNPRTGGIIISSLQSKTELEDLIAQDPFAINKLVRYNITEFRAIKAHPELQHFIES